MEDTGVRLRARALATLSPLIERVRASSWPAGVQRFGRKAEQAFARIASRWPGLRTRRTEPPAAPTYTPRQAPPRPKAPVEPPIAAPPEVAVIEPADENTATILRLLADLETSSSWEVRVSAATGLGDFHGDLVLDGLVSAMRDESAEVAIASIAALARQPGARAAADLEEVLRDSAGYVSPYTRAAAVCAIARVRGADVLPLLLDTVHDVDAEVSIASIDAAAELAPNESLPRLRTLLEDRSGYFLPAVRLATANALVRVRVLGPDLARALLATEPDDEVRAVLRIASQN